MKYLDRFLKAERRPDLPSALSVPSPKRIRISEEEEEDQKCITDRTDKTDRSPPESRRHQERALTEQTEGVTAPRSAQYVPDPEICSWCGVAIVTVPGVLALARRTAVGDLLHPKCWTESTRGRRGKQPATPTLDRLIAELEEA